MKITKSQLRQIIKEELSRVFEQDSKGYKVVEKKHGMVGFEGPDGEDLGLDSGDLMKATEKIPGFFDIVDKDFLKRHRKGSRFPYPDASAMMDYGGFMPGKTFQNLLNFYVEKVLNK